MGDGQVPTRALQKEHVSGRGSDVNKGIKYTEPLRSECIRRDVARHHIPVNYAQQFNMGGQINS